MYAEGPTDYYFLQPLLKRLCEDCCCQHAGSWVEISEVLGLDHPPHQKDAPRAERILAAAQSAAGAWQLLFVHADGSNDPPTMHREQIQPALTLLGQHFTRQGAGVAVLPVRETEAWAIADGNALRQVLGSRLSDEQLGLPALARVASTTDPKQVLEQAIARNRGGGRRRPIPSSHYLASLGQEVALDRLRQLDAFAQLEADVVAALRQLGIVR